MILSVSTYAKTLLEGISPPYPKKGVTEYKTIGDLANAVEGALASKSDKNIAGQSKAMWLTNAEWVAENKFNHVERIRELRRKYAVTRRQDLQGDGDAVFGAALPKRGYGIGDNVPGVGKIVDEVETKLGKQFLIAGQWYLENRTEFAKETRAAIAEDVYKYVEP